MTSVAVDLARWACDLEPSAADLALAGRSLADTGAVTLPARGHPAGRLGGTPPPVPCDLEPSAADLALAGRSLADTVAVTLAARDHPVARLAATLPEGARWAVAAHIADFDDLHMPSTTHISAVCVPTALAAGGGARAYLAAAGVMARLGTALGWPHYSAGWHATCTAGAPARAARAPRAHPPPP